MGPLKKFRRNTPEIAISHNKHWIRGKEIAQVMREWKSRGEKKIEVKRHKESSRRTHGNKPYKLAKLQRNLIQNTQ